MNGQPAPRFGICGSRDQNGCGQEIQWRVDGTKLDGSPAWHPFNVVVELNTGFRRATETCHFQTCERRANFGRGRCRRHEDQAPAHVHAYEKLVRFDLEAGRQVSVQRCPCGSQVEA